MVERVDVNVFQILFYSARDGYIMLCGGFGFNVRFSLKLETAAAA